MYIKLRNYVTDKNAWNTLFGAKPIAFPLDQSGVYAVAEHLGCDLSPENLCCDGEARISHIMRQRKTLDEVHNELRSYCYANKIEYIEPIY